MSYVVVGIYSFACDHPEGCTEAIECTPGRVVKPLAEAHGTIRLKGWAVTGRRAGRQHFCPAHTPASVSLKAQLVIPRGVLGPTRRSRVGPTAPVPTSSGPTRLGPEPLATSLARLISSVPRTGPRGAGTSSRTPQVGPREVRPVGPAQVREITHRLSYELYVAPIPADFTIDHLCFNPSCVRPDHLRAIPRRANDLRKREFGYAACPECQRVIGGRYLSGMDAQLDGKIKLLRHKQPDSLTWCKGAGSIMQAAAGEGGSR